MDLKVLKMFGDFVSFYVRLFSICFGLVKVVMDVFDWYDVKYLVKFVEKFCWLSVFCG